MILGTQEHADAFFLKKYPETKLPEFEKIDDVLTRAIEEIHRNMDAEFIGLHPVYANFIASPQKSVDEVKLMSAWPFPVRHKE